MSDNGIQRAEAHEALVVRLLRLLKQAETVGARRPDEPVSASVGSIAADLLFDVGRFLQPGRRGMPQPAPDYPGLAAELGQALARLEDFEARHTVWDASLGAFVWQIAPGKVRPIARLRQPLAAVPEQDRRHRHEMREKLERRIKAKYEENYEAGFRAGKAAAEAGEAGADAGSRVVAAPR